MKFALINEEQIHSIDFVLEYARATSTQSFVREELEHALAIVKSLKASEPRGFFFEFDDGLLKEVPHPAMGFPLYALEQL